MITRVFRGKEIPAILTQIREEHGEEAVILSTRELGRNDIEVRVGIPQKEGRLVSHIDIAAKRPLISSPSVPWPVAEERSNTRSTVRKLLSLLRFRFLHSKRSLIFL